MRRSSNNYIGGPEVNSLIGRWSSIVGGGPWQDVIGADVNYLNPYNRYRTPTWNQWGQPHHHHHHRNWNQWGSQWGNQWGRQSPYVRDHRAYVSGGYALMGAEAAAANAAAAAAAPALPPLAAMPPPAAAPPAAPPSAMLAPPPVTAPTASEVQPGHPDHPDNVVAPDHPAHPAHPHHPHHRRWRDTGGCAMPVQALNQFGPTPYPYSIPPRNLLVDRPGPTGADRVILPMSSGVNILPNTSAQITSRPQNYAFRPERVIIAGATDWVINDVKVGNMSQFSQSGDVPGEMFAATTIDGFVKFTTCQTAMDFVIVTTFVGASESGAPFVCGVLGTAAVQ